MRKWRGEDSDVRGEMVFVCLWWLEPGRPNERWGCFKGRGKPRRLRFKQEIILETQLQATISTEEENYISEAIVSTRANNAIPELMVSSMEVVPLIEKLKFHCLPTFPCNHHCFAVELHAPIL